MAASNKGLGHLIGRVGAEYDGPLLHRILELLEQRAVSTENTLVTSGVAAGGSAPDSVPYLTLVADADLSAERVLTVAGAAITLTDNGPNSTAELALGADLEAIEALVGTSGLLAKTAADTWALRSLAAPASFLTIANPAGVAGDPTFAFSGTSGGVPYFNSATTVATSALLTASALLLGGGAGASPTALGNLGTTTTVLHGNAAGAPTFAAVALATDVSGDLPFANLAQGSALSVLGVTGNAIADLASIVAASDFQVLRRSGTAVAFGAVNLASTNAVTGTLPVGNGGTGATAFTLGSVVFAGTSGVYTQDNAKLFWDDTNNRLGIGTAAPGAPLHVLSATSDFRVGNLAGYGSEYVAVGLSGSIAAGNYNFLSGTTTKDLFINRPSGYTMYFMQNHSMQMYLSTGGVLVIENSGAGLFLSSTTGNTQATLKRATVTGTPQQGVLLFTHDVAPSAVLPYYAVGLESGSAYAFSIDFYDPATSPTYKNRLRYDVPRTVSGATSFLNCSVANNTGITVSIAYGVEVFDGTEVQTEGGCVLIAATKKGASAIADVGVSKYGTEQSMSAGTLDVSFDGWTVSGNTLTLKVTVTTSLTPSANYPKFTAQTHNLTSQAVVYV